MHEERDTLWHFVMSIVKYHESHYVAVLDRYEVGSMITPELLYNTSYYQLIVSITKRTRNVLTQQLKKDCQNLMKTYQIRQFGPVIAN